MFRYITAIVLLTAFAAQTFQQAFVVLNYYTNAAPFARNCENKERPALHCNGKCQLMKKMQEEEKKDRQVPERKLETKNEVVSSLSFFATLHLAHPQSMRIFRLPQPSPVYPGCFSEIFHPPTV
ncbi:hypothetical protein [Flavisolibacter nicotianae]|uniref:hypothetical protein n=1 Tax=Flavisolibacter nicotianae TaxID=2364882 RepID=UPI000EAE7090|nr:hypothetical protein [Flavisolibacter nicotianae]